MSLDNIKEIREGKKNLWIPKENKKSWMHRAQGVSSLLIAGFFGYVGAQFDVPSAEIASGIFAADGVGDVVTGYHHYAFQKAHEGTKYLTNKIRK